MSTAAPGDVDIPHLLKAAWETTVRMNDSRSSGVNRF